MPPIARQRQRTVFGAIDASTATNWPGSAYDPETHTVFAQAGNMGASARSLVAPPSRFSDIRYVSGMAGRPFREVFGPGDCCAADAGRRTAEERSNTQPNATSPGALAEPPVAAAERRSQRRRGCRSRSRRTACCPRSTSIAANCSGRCRTARRRTTSAITRCSGA